MLDLTGRVALITGAARGQGRAHALALAAAGADIIAFDICAPIATQEYDLANPDDLDQTAKEVENLDRRVLAIQGDVRSDGDLERAVAAGITEFGKVDILVANAGIWQLAPLWEITDDMWRDVHDVNLFGVFKSIRAVAPHMIERRSGSIVLTSSVNGVEPGVGMAHYVAAKHGVIGLMRNAALELAPHNVRCNAVLPGAVDSKMNDWQGSYDMMAGHAGGTPEDRANGGHHWAALAGRGLINPDSISRAVRFLASDEAQDITGVALPVDAGHLVLPGMNMNPVRSP